MPFVSFSYIISLAKASNSSQIDMVRVATLVLLTLEETFHVSLLPVIMLEVGFMQVKPCSSHSFDGKEGHS